MEVKILKKYLVLYLMKVYVVNIFSSMEMNLHKRHLLIS